MKIHRMPVDFYTDMLRRGQRFVLFGYSDAEWFCVLGQDIGRLTGAGQPLTEEAGRDLFDVVRRRWDDPHVMFAVPLCMWTDGTLWHEFGVRVDTELSRAGIRMDCYERDMILDELAERAGLYPWIRQLREMRVAMVGNQHLRRFDAFPLVQFVEIPQCDLHTQSTCVQLAVQELISGTQSIEVCLVSAGIGSAFVIDKAMDYMPNTTFIDCGSIWDAFVGIGGQREWRAKLYTDPAKLEEWKRVCTTGE